MSERLQKLLARHGFGSRRVVENWIIEGRVLLNGKPAQLGDQFKNGDRLSLDGRDITSRLSVEVSKQALIYHKPQGQALEYKEPVDTDSEQGDESESTAPKSTAPSKEMDLVSAYLPKIRASRWIPINPMHGGDSGLLLLTNDGELGYALTRRKRWIPTVYMVRVLAPGSSEKPPELPLSIQLDDESVEFSKVEPEGGEGANFWYRVEMPRADKRMAVRALFESHDLKVSRMTQVSFGDIQLPRDLPRMRHRALTATQLESLYALAQIDAPKSEPDEPKKLRGRTGREFVKPATLKAKSREGKSRGLKSGGARSEGAQSRGAKRQATRGDKSDRKPASPTRRSSPRGARTR